MPVVYFSGITLARTSAPPATAEWEVTQLAGRAETRLSGPITALRPVSPDRRDGAAPSSVSTDRRATTLMGVG
jgi:hypothetical protein